MNDIDIRWSRTQERDELLRFIERMGFNPRDSVTWDALHMRAMTAWRGDQLVGAIPLETRPLRVEAGTVLSTIHETVVAVDPDRRDQGIGSAMQKTIFENPPEGAKLITVFREEPDSPAYRWYLKNDFQSLVQVDSWSWEGQAEPVDGFQLLPASDAGIDWASLQRLWTISRESSAGFVDLGHRPLQRWLQVHPYRSRYAFHILFDRSLSSYAVLGVGNMHSPTERIDVLDVVSEGRPDRLLHAIQHGSTAHRWRPVRWTLSRRDPNISLAEAAGFEKKQAFDVLARPLDPSLDLQDAAQQWIYRGIDYA